MNNSKRLVKIIIWVVVVMMVLSVIATFGSLLS